MFFGRFVQLTSFFFNDPATTEIYTLSLHDALPILPETARMLEAPGGEPFVDILAASDLRLERTERSRARFAFRKRAARLLPRVAGDALALLQSLHRVAESAERGLARGEIGALLLQLVGNHTDLLGERRPQRSGFGIQPLAPLEERGERLACALAPGLADADRLLERGDALLSFGERIGGGRHRRFGAGHGAGSDALVFGGGRASLRCRGELALAVARFAPDGFDLRRQPAQQLGDLRGLLRETILAFPGELQLLLEPSHLRVGGVERSLLLVQLVAAPVLLGAQRFHPVFGRAQLRLHGFERGGQIG